MDAEIYIDAEGFLYADNMRLPLRFDFQRAVLEFCDKDARRSLQRGSRYVDVSAEDFAQLLLQLVNGSSSPVSSSSLTRLQE